MPPELPKAVITKRIDVSHDLWLVWLKPQVPYTFKPGQYITVGVDGLERPYSIVSAPYEPEIELFIELVPLPAGMLTPVLHKMGAGAMVSIRPKAKGIFTFDEKYHNHLMVATVTGVVPYVSMIRQYLHDGRRGHRFYVLQGASYQDEFTYDKELTRLSHEHPDFIKYVATVSRPDEERNRSWTGEKGRANTLLEKYVQKWGLDKLSTLIYACGHPGMIEDVKARGTAAGYTVKEERFWKED